MFSLKSILAISITTMALNLNAYSIFPKNDLHLEDNNKKISNITEEQFNKIIDIALDSYQKEADEFDEKLKINRKWNDSTVNANMSRFWGRVTINMYGGLARREEVVPDSFALVLCHELGHAYGGEPYLRDYSKIAAEGQADYYGARHCLERIFQEFPADPVNEQVLTDSMIEMCQQRIADMQGEAREEEQAFCERALVAGYGLGKLLAVIKDEDIPSYETPDQYVTPHTMLSYPKTVQCRLDTYRAGALKEDRPLCWYNPEDQQ